VKDEAIYLLCLDPGFASVGVVVLKLTSKGEFVKVAKLIETKKAPKKQRLLVAHENVQRTIEIVRALRELDQQFMFRAICAESMSFPRNSSAAAKMAMCWGALCWFSESARTPILQARPQEIRAALGLKAGAGRKVGKEIVAARLRRKFKKAAKVIEAAAPPSKQEHLYDALAAGVACLQASEIQFVRNLVQPNKRGR